MSDKEEVLGAVSAAVEEAAGGMTEGMMDIESAPLGAEISLDLLARRLPKSELHLHFEGAIPPATVGRLARRAGVASPADKMRPDSLYDYRGFAHFIDGMRDACALMVDDDAVIEAALDVFARGIDAGARHIELMTTLQYHIEHDREPRGYLAALGRAFAQAEEMWGMSGGIIVEFDRPAGPDKAKEIAEIAADARDAGAPVLAVGNDGDPLTMPFRELAPAYEYARSRGLKLTGHADLPDDITAALELGLDRIDHGFFAIYDQGVMDQLVAKQIPMTLCITSNVIQMPGLYADFEVHPLKALVDAGCNVTLNTDDPPMFYTDLAQEYRAASQALGWGPKEMGDAARRSLHASWILADRDARLAAWEREIEVLVEDPRVSRGGL